MLLGMYEKMSEGGDGDVVDGVYTVVILVNYCFVISLGLISFQFFRDPSVSTAL